MKYIIFDIDGTLTNTKIVDDLCYIKALKTLFEIDLGNEGIWDNLKNATDWGITEETFFNHFNRLPTADEFQELKELFLDELFHESQKNPQSFGEISGAKAFFYLVNSKEDFRVGIATGSWKKSGEIKLNSIGINPNDFAYSNSDKFISREEILLDVIQQLDEKFQEKPEKIVYFGDGIWDYKTCKNLGIPLIGIDVLNDRKLKNLGVDFVFNDFLSPDRVFEAIEFI